jgi:hypothetical protein
MSKLMINLLKFVKEKKIQNKDQAVKQEEIPQILNSLKKIMFTKPTLLLVFSL